MRLAAADQQLRNSIIEKDQSPTKREHREAILRVLQVADLNAVGARYHRDCLSKFYNSVDKTSSCKNDSPSIKAAQYIVDQVLTNKDECQYSIKQLLTNFSGDVPDLSYVKNEVINILGDDVIFHSDQRTGDHIITLKTVAEKILTASWFKKQEKTKEERDAEVVKEAGKIILESIQAKFFYKDSYPAPEFFFDNLDNEIPELLRFLLNEIISTSKKATSLSTYKIKVNAIAQCIISAARPKCAFPCLQVGLSAYLMRKFGSKELVQVLNSLGFCSSYDESRLLEASMVDCPQALEISGDIFAQMVADNADHIVNTLDGRSIHIMAIISCITPASSVRSNRRIPRLSAALTAEDVGKKRPNCSKTNSE